MVTELRPPVISAPRRGLWGWWRGVTQNLRLETRLLFAATLAVSLVVSGFTYWAVNSVQQDAQFSDIRFGQDLGLLLAADVGPLVAEGNTKKLAQLSRQYYQNTTSIRYLLYADPDGQIYYGIPFSNSEVKTSLSLTRRIQLPDNHVPLEGQALLRTHNTPNGRVTDIFVGIYDNHKFLGTLALGINPNETLMAASRLTREVSIGVFVAVWVLAILGAVVNALTITQPIKELVEGVQGIALGNFQQRIQLPFGGELAQLINSFNEMAQRLQSYEEQNIEEMTAAKAKLDILVSTIVDGAVLVDAELMILLVNPAAVRIFGWDAATVVGERLLEQLPDNLRGEMTRPLFQMVRGELEGQVFQVKLPEPNPRVVRLLVSTVLDQKRQNLKGLVMTVQDITREVELNEAKNQFISNVSHELRTPLFSIKSFIETLYEYDDQISPAERKNYLEIANNETDRLTRLVNDVLDLSRLESGRQYRFDGLDIAALIEQTLRTYQLTARDQQITISSAIDSDLPLVWGNYDLLLQVFTNLVGNSLKFTPAGGKVTIHAHKIHSQEQRCQGVRIAVSDTGIGIDPVDHARIFDRFFRVENRVHTLEGTGLGLSIVRNILEKHHTKIHLDSKVGQGTTFWFDLHLFDSDSHRMMTQENIVDTLTGCDWPPTSMTNPSETITSNPIA